MPCRSTICLHAQLGACGGPAETPRGTDAPGIKDVTVRSRGVIDGCQWGPRWKKDPAQASGTGCWRLGIVCHGVVQLGAVEDAKFNQPSAFGLQRRA